MGRSRKVRCIFCEHFRERGREHVWSDWIGQEAKRRGFRGTVTAFRLNDVGVLVPFTRNDFAFTSRIPDVCQVCNGGWMADIEDAVAPILKPVIFDGAATTIDSESALWIATWIYLRALVLQYSALKRELPRHYCRALFSSQTRPPASKIWIGATTPEHMDQSDFTSAALHVPPWLPVGSHDEPFLATFTVGHLVARVFMYPQSLQGDPQVRAVNTGVFDGFLHTIWPNHDPFEWPTKRLNLRAYLALAQTMPLYPALPPA